MLQEADGLQRRVVLRVRVVTEEIYNRSLSLLELHVADNAAVDV